MSWWPSIWKFWLDCRSPKKESPISVNVCRYAREVTHVNLGARHAISRDPDDDVLLAAAQSG
jgi:hypothetical protein